MSEATGRGEAHVFTTHFGEMLVVLGGRGRIRLLTFVGERDPRSLVEDDVTWPVPGGGGEEFAEVESRVAEFLAGDRRDLELEPEVDGTPFQRSVWAAVRRIPYGQTASYGEIAEQVGRPHAARAIGRANATNPVSLIVPCHRVIGTDGSLTGYAGGVATKRRLLALEATQRELYGAA